MTEHDTVYRSVPTLIAEGWRPTEPTIPEVPSHGPDKTHLRARISIALVNLDYIKLPQGTRVAPTVPSIERSAFDLPARVS